MLMTSCIQAGLLTIKAGVQFPLGLLPCVQTAFQSLKGLTSLVLPALLSTSVLNASFAESVFGKTAHHAEDQT